MENLVFTQLSISEIRELFRQELETYFTRNGSSNSSSISNDELLTIQQAAEIIKVSVPTIYGLVQKAKIPVCKKGKRLYFSKDEITQWIRLGRKKTVGEIEKEALEFVNGSKKRRS